MDKIYQFKVVNAIRRSMFPVLLSIFNISVSPLNRVSGKLSIKEYAVQIIPARVLPMHPDRLFYMIPFMATNPVDRITNFNFSALLRCLNLQQYNALSVFHDDISQPILFLNFKKEVHGEN